MAEPFFTGANALYDATISTKNSGGNESQCTVTAGTMLLDADDRIVITPRNETVERERDKACNSYVRVNPSGTDDPHADMADTGVTADGSNHSIIDAGSRHDAAEQGHLYRIYRPLDLEMSPNDKSGNARCRL